MTTWRFQLRPRSAWATPWRADSIFGAICWTWLELFPGTFEEMLVGFAGHGDPPFIISDAFPGNLLPLPLHARMPVSERKLKPPIYLSETSFRKVLEASALSPAEVVDKPFGSEPRVRTAIDRNLGSAAHGQLFEIDTQYLRKGLETLSIYVRSDHWLEPITACFKALSLSGFGKKSSSGLGAFDVSEGPQTCEWLDHVDGANAFVSLSHFVPAPADPAEGRWRLHVSYPKFHANAVRDVFKGSILMMTPGSVFVTGAAPRDWYGSMIPMGRPETPKAMHYALAFAAPAKWEDRG